MGNVFEHGNQDTRTEEQILEIARRKYHHDAVFHNTVETAVALVFKQPWSIEEIFDVKSAATDAAAIALVISQSNGAF